MILAGVAEDATESVVIVAELVSLMITVSFCCRVQNAALLLWSRAGVFDISVEFKIEIQESLHCLVALQFPVIHDAGFVCLFICGMFYR